MPTLTSTLAVDCTHQPSLPTTRTPAKVSTLALALTLPLIEAQRELGVEKAEREAQRWRLEGELAERGAKVG